LAHSLYESDAQLDLILISCVDLASQHRFAVPIHSEHPQVTSSLITQYPLSETEGRRSPYHKSESDEQKKTIQEESTHYSCKAEFLSVNYFRYFDKNDISPIKTRLQVRCVHRFVLPAEA
jgi:hypothetical protein